MELEEELLFKQYNISGYSQDNTEEKMGRLSKSSPNLYQLFIRIKRKTRLSHLRNTDYNKLKVSGS